jgi:chloramphenicol 3-O phosphotransferase
MPVKVEVIVLNGGSSAGKSSLATCLQERLDGTWLTLGIDDLIRALSYGPRDRGAGGTIDFGPDGSVAVGERFRDAEAAWYEGLAAIARAGTGVIVDDVFLDAIESQARLRTALEGLSVFWVGVRCRPEVAEARELLREGRVRGMARDQAERVHVGVRYDMVVDTTETSAGDCALAIEAMVRSSSGARRQ